MSKQRVLSALEDYEETLKSLREMIMKKKELAWRVLEKTNELRAASETACKNNDILELERIQGYIECLEKLVTPYLED